MALANMGFKDQTLVSCWRRKTVWERRMGEEEEEEEEEGGIKAKKAWKLL